MWHAIMLDPQVFGIKRAEEFAWLWSAVLTFSDESDTQLKAVAEIGLYRIADQEELNEMLSLIAWCVRKYAEQQNPPCPIHVEIVYAGEPAEGVQLGLHHTVPTTLLAEG